MSVTNTGGGAHWTGGLCGGTPTSCYLWAGPYVQTAKFWREKLDELPTLVMNYLPVRYDPCKLVLRPL